MSILVSSYTENGYQPIPSVRLSDDEYGRGLQCFVPACTDIVPINVDRQIIYLARRASKPMTGWWWIGGRMAPCETKEEAVARNFKRETGLELPQNRFKLMAIFDYRCKDRNQSPQEVGCHMLGYTFTVELAAMELTSISVDLDEQKEYEKGTSLFAFDRERLVREGVFPSILDLYDHVFLHREEVESGSLELVSSDARHNIRELEFSGSVFQEFYIRDTAGPFGQHFHRKKFEIFYFFDGGGTIRTARVNAEGKIVGEIKQFEAGMGSVIRIPPMHTCHFDFAPNTRFVVFSSEAFDPNDIIACSIE